MSPGRARWGLLVALVTGCAARAPTRPTRVDGEERVVADDPARTRWFATLYSLQRQLATADARRLDVLGPLQVMLCRPPDASLSRLAAVAQARMRNTGVVMVRTRLRRTPDSEQALSRWIEATAAATGDAVERESLIAIEETLVIERMTPTGAVPLSLPAAAPAPPEPRCDPGAVEGAQGSDGAAVLAQLARVLRRAAAQALTFQRSLGLAGELQAQLPTVAAGAAPALAAEFRAADRALTGVTARATMHLHESARTQQWAQALLTPEGETPPEEEPEGMSGDSRPADPTIEPGP